MTRQGLLDDALAAYRTLAQEYPQVKLPDGHKVTIEGPAVDGGDAAVADVLAKLRKQVLGATRNRGEAA